jgi:arylsulfatase A-like enzyme
MFTGKWCHELSVGWDRPLDRASPTLAEFLAERGYATAGFVANTTYCSYETGLARGFAHYEDYDVSTREILLCSALVQRTLNFVHKHPAIERRLVGDATAGEHRKSAARINRDFLRWLSRHPGRPFFAFLNLFDAHHPYLPPDGPEFGRAPESSADVRMLRTWWDLDKRTLARRDVELARDAYDRCIAYLDREVGRLVDELERRGVLRDTLLVITADHGEHLGEKNLFGHGCSLYLPELHVPLLVIAPGAVPEGRAVAEPVSLRDLPATVVNLLGLRGSSPFPGRSLERAWSGDPSGPILSEIDAPPESDPNRGESPVCRGPLASLIDADFHYIRNGDGREELYDLDDDPREARDLSGAPGLARELRRFREAIRDRVSGSGEGIHHKGTKLTKRDTK